MASERILAIHVQRSTLDRWHRYTDPDHPAHALIRRKKTVVFAKDRAEATALIDAARKAAAAPENEATARHRETLEAIASEIEKRLGL